jgi:hypothetical protein
MSQGHRLVVKEWLVVPPAASMILGEGDAAAGVGMLVRPWYVLLCYVTTSNWKRVLRSTPVCLRCRDCLESSGCVAGAAAAQ